MVYRLHDSNDEFLIVLRHDRFLQCIKILLCIFIQNVINNGQIQIVLHLKQKE